MIDCGLQAMRSNIGLRWAVGFHCSMIVIVIKALTISPVPNKSKHNNCESRQRPAQVQWEQLNFVPCHCLEAQNTPAFGIDRQMSKLYEAIIVNTSGSQPLVVSSCEVLDRQGIQLRKRHVIVDDRYCYMCKRNGESIDHIFHHCEYNCSIQNVFFSQFKLP